MDGITYRTDDAGRWLTGKGANLTPTEVDLNFWELYSRLKNLEDNAPLPVMITDITVIGSTFQVEMSDGSHFGPFDLPIAKFEWQGAWVNDAIYAKLDLVTVPQKGLYIVMFPHTAPHTGPFDESAVDVGTGDPIYIKIFGEDTYIYDFGFFYPGKPGIGIDDGYAIAGHIFGRDVVLPAAMECDAKLFDACDADMSFDVQVDGVVKGTLDFTAGGTVGTLTWAADVDAPEGTRLRLMKPTDGVDASARELSVTLKGVQVTFP
jgi:hypothetical protein